MAIFAMNSFLKPFTGIFLIIIIFISVYGCDGGAEGTQALGTGTISQNVLKGKWTASGYDCRGFVLDFDGEGLVTRRVSLEKSTGKKRQFLSATYTYNIDPIDNTLTIDLGPDRIVRSIDSISNNRILLSRKNPDAYQHLFRCTDSENFESVKTASKTEILRLASELALKRYVDSNQSFRQYIHDYDFLGDYLNYSTSLSPYTVPTDSTKIADDGVVRIKYGKVWYLNPVSASWQALHYYGRYAISDGTDLESRDRFLSIARVLVDHQNPDGGFPYPVNYNLLQTYETLKKDWYSGMAQGVVLSVFTRAYSLSNDDSFIEAGRKAFEILIKPMADGGTMSTLANLGAGFDDYIFFEEYPEDPPTHVLNGFCYALIGVYDWIHLHTEILGTTADDEENWFNNALDALELILPLYDINGFCAYDLSHLTWDGPVYHISYYYQADHIVLMDILYQTTGRQIFRDFAVLWASAVNQLNDLPLYPD